MCGMSTFAGHAAGHARLQGMAGGPIMALSQTLLLRLPEEKAMMATGLWAMTPTARTGGRPGAGRLDLRQLGWPWVYIINVPMALVFSLVAWILIRRYEDPLVKSRMDVVGFILLVIWVGALQIMLDEAKTRTGLPPKRSASSPSSR